MTSKRNKGAHTMTPDNRRQKVIGVNYDLLFTIGPGFRPVPGISILITHVNSLWAYQIFMNAQATTHIGQRPTFATALRDALTLARDFSNQLSMTNSSVNLKNLLEQLPDTPAEVAPETADVDPPPVDRPDPPPVQPNRFDCD